MFAVASECAGTPRQWSATDERSGLAVVAAIEDDCSVDASYKGTAATAAAVSHSRPVLCRAFLAGSLLACLACVYCAVHETH
jgi:hypothetical protein